MGIVSEFKRILNLEIKKRDDPQLYRKLKQYVSRKPILKSGVQSRVGKDDYELFDKQEMRCIELNKAAKAILSKCNGEHTLENICQELYAGPLSDKFLEDTAQFLFDLENLGVLEWK